MTFVGFLEAAGKAFEKGLKWAVQFAVPVERLVGLLFPAAAPATAVLLDATELIQTAVLLVEQKYTAAGRQSGTGPQKLAEVLVLTETAVLSLLKQAGVTADTGFIERIVAAVVAILNVQLAPTGLTTPTPAA